MTKTIKKIQKHLDIDVDGVFGNQTLEAVAAKLGVVASLRVIQHTVGAHVDGIFGPNTAAHIAVAFGLEWPTQAEVRSGKSIFGKAGDVANLVNIVPPYPLYFEGREVKTIRVHKLIKNAVLEALNKIKNAYTPAQIHTYGLDDYSGSFNYRPTASGKSLSMHAWGIALDFAAASNGYSTHSPYASLSRPECRAFWEAWESVGAVSLGRARDYDWMHLQFAALN